MTISASTPRDLPKALAEHKSIVASLKRRDAAQAEARMRGHVRRSLVTHGPLLSEAARRRR